MLSVPPEVLMGEAGICGFWAMVAVAYVYQRNQQMYGWQGTVSEEARLAAQVWPIIRDPSEGAQFVFSAADLVKPEVRRILERAGPPKVVFRCQVGKLVFY